MKLNLHIDRVIFDGLPLSSHEAHAVHAALSGELARMIANSGIMLPSSAAIPMLAAGTMTTGAEITPCALGRDVAGALYRVIGGPASTR